MGLNTRRVLAVLVFACAPAAVLLTLPYIWPWFQHKLPTLDMPLLFAAGWMWAGIWKRQLWGRMPMWRLFQSRQIDIRAGEPMTDEQLAEFRRLFDEAQRRFGS